MHLYLLQVSPLTVISAAYWNVPFDLTPSFTGRDEIYKYMKDECLKRIPRAGNRIFVLFGIAGSGKTSLCLKFVWECRCR